MPRLPPIYSSFFDRHLTEDVEELLACFQQTDSVRYESFSAIWRDRCFSDVFRGISNVSELRRYCRVALATAVKYFLPPYSYQIRVGGLYLMFALYHTQPLSPPVSIRVSLKDWAHIQAFLKDSAQCRHLDVVYIYQKLNSIKAIHYTAMPHLLVFQKQQKQKQESVCARFLGRATAVHDLMSSDILEDVAKVQGHYEKLKEATMEVTGQVTMTNRDFASKLKDCLTDFLTWQEKTFSSQVNKHKKAGDDEEEAEEKASSSRARLLSSIKQRSYNKFQEAPKARRHRRVETVESCSSGAEQVQGSAGPTEKKGRPPSLRARTWKNLGMTQDEIKLKKWLLTAPEQQEGPPQRRTNQVAPYKP